MSNTTTYKQTAIGLIPSDWEVKKLGALGTVISGLTYSPDDISEEMGTLVLRSSNIQDRQLVFDDNVFVNVDEDSFNPVQENDILICVRNGSKSLIGKSALISKEIEGVAFGAFMAIFRSEHNNYLFQIFGTDLYQKEIHKNLGATINSINGSDLRQFKIPIPPLPEQQKIAEILGTFDQAISTTKQIIEELKVRNKGLAKQLLTGKMRVKGFESSKWETLKLGKLGNVISGLTYSPDDINEEEGVLVLRSSNIQDKKIDLKSTVYVKSAQYNPVLKDDILICVRNGSRDLIGKNLLIPKELEGVAFGAFMSVFRSKYNSYLIHLFDSEFYYREIQKNLGATINSINGSDLKKFKFPIPTFEEQKAITNILDKATAELNQYQQKLETLQLQKKGLMQQLLTGKTRVRIYI